jgi:hypothetical protein
MGITHGNSLCSYLYFKLAKHCVSHFIFLFFFYKIREKEGRTSPARGYSGRGEVMEKAVKDEYGANNVYTCM